MTILRSYHVSYSFRNNGDERSRRQECDTLEEAQAKCKRLKDGARFLTGDSGFSNIRLVVEIADTRTEVVEYHGTINGPEYVGDLDEHWPTIQLDNSNGGEGPNIVGILTTTSKIREVLPGCYRCRSLLGERHDSECSEYRSWGREYVDYRSTASEVDDPPKKPKMTAATEVGDQA